MSVAGENFPGFFFEEANMKCICPMGGDRVCPDDCPLAVWATLPPSNRKAQRKPIAEQLYRQGFTMEQIATQLGVSTKQISRDLVGFDIGSKPERPKGGRPKGSGKAGRRGQSTPKTDQAREIIRPLLEANTPVSPHKLQKEHGISHVTFDMAITAETGWKEGRDQGLLEALGNPKVYKEVLSLTAQQTLDAAIRQHKRKLDLEFGVRMREELKRHLDAVALPAYAKEIAALERSIRDRKGIMDRVTYRKILACLHPDRVADPALKKRYEEAFRLFTELEKRVLSEKESPTQFRDIPRTYEDLMRMKAKVKADRAAQRAAKANINPR